MRFTASLGVTWCLAVLPAMAIADSARFEIAPQPMPAALKAFAAQATPIQLLYVYSVVENARGNSVHGELDKREALSRLLGGTGLEAVFVSDTEVIIRSISAASPFDGTWVWDTDTAQLPTKPDIYLLDRGAYRCKSCVPPVEVRADGKDHRVTGQSYYDTIAVTIANSRVVKIAFSKDRKLSGQQTLTVSEDGKHLTSEYEDDSAAKPVISRVQAERIAGAAAGAHAISGSWRQTKIDSVSENGSTVTLKVTAEGVSFKDPNGTGYEAKFDGKDYPMVGDIGNTVVSVRRLDERTFEETAKRDGKVESVIRLRVLADGGTAEYIAEDRRQGSTTRGTLHKKTRSGSPGEY